MLPVRVPGVAYKKEMRWSEFTEKLPKYRIQRQGCTKTCLTDNVIHEEEIITSE